MHFGVSILLFLPLCFCVQLEWIGVGVGARRIEGIEKTSFGSESVEGLVELLRIRGIGKIRLHNADSAMLHAIGTISSSTTEAPMEVIIGVTNDEIVDLGVSPTAAQSWIASNVVPFFPATNIIAIAVGSEVLSSRDADHQSTIVPFLVPAMRNLHDALLEVGLEKQIKLSAPQCAQLMSSHFSSSSATFNNGGITTDSAMTPLLEFLASSESYFMLNLYPQDLEHDGMVGVNMQQQHEEDFKAGGKMDDRQSGRHVHYSSMVDGLSEAVSMAMASFGHHQPSLIGIEMEWSETGSSSNGFKTHHSLRGLAVDINPTLVDHFVIGKDMELSQTTASNAFKTGHIVLREGAEHDIDRRFVENSGTSSRKVEKNVEKTVVRRVVAFSSRKFLMDPLQAKQTPDGETDHESGKRRRLADKSWCVAKPGASTDDLQSSLDWACGTGGGVDCDPITVGQSCFLPNTLVAHASYAFNSYYQMRSWASEACDFGGIAQITTSDPSTTTCLYASSTSANGTPTTPTGNVLPSLAAPSRVTWDRCRIILSSFILIFLLNTVLQEFEV
ncbi:unnamed protein product [Calypogeia fissa]